MSEEPEEIVQHPITDELDLHSFRPKDLGSLLPEYFHACREKRLFTVRIIHGKGTGALREGVHRLLDTLPEVASWQWPASAQSGGWGATWVWLKPPT
jgi:DNA-nicking Smr family endonuclease